MLTLFFKYKSSVILKSTLQRVGGLSISIIPLAGKTPVIRLHYIIMIRCPHMKNNAEFTVFISLISISNVQEQVDKKVKYYRGAVSGQSLSSLWSDHPCS